MKYPPTLKEKVDAGGTIPMYETEIGIWFSVFRPFTKDDNETVALLEADIDFF